MPNSPDNIRTYFELQPILPTGQWWQVALIVFALLGLIAFVIWMIRRDSQKLPTALAVLLTGLRLFAVACLITYLLNPGQRSESRVLTQSRLAVLVDTSLSMGLRDRGKLPVSEFASSSQRRIDQVVQWIESQDELTRLRNSHDLTLYRFGDSGQPEPIVVLPRSGADTPDDASDSAMTPGAAVDELESRDAQRLVWLAVIAALVAVVLFLVWAFAMLRATVPERKATWLAGWVGTTLLALVMVGLADLASAKRPVLSSIQQAFGGSTASDAEATIPALSEPAATIDGGQDSLDDPLIKSLNEIDWQQELLPTGTSTTLGASIKFIVNKERGGPLAGVVVFTDGQSNNGIPVVAAAVNAANANVPVFPVGIGSTDLIRNVEVADLQVPPRVFPDDRFKVKAVLKSQGMPGRSINVKIVSLDEKETEAEQLEAETTITLGEDGEAIPFEVEIKSGEEGKRRYIVRADNLEDDIDATDNERGATVEIVRGQTKVLLIAGGPNREFRFLRNQLYRDSDVLLHVWLQSAKQGADQESDVLLQGFPETETEMFFYDCIVAFDADWRALSQDQADMLERWVAEKAGGLVLVAGPVNTPEWTRRPRGDEAIDLIRQLYPVSFFSQGTAQLKLGRFGGSEAFPLEFSREGRATRFLWLEDSAVESAQTWDQFEGVFGYYAVNESKAGADVLASFGDPATAMNGQLPIYLASQYYGAGRVYFQASAEMWRVRNIDVEYFQDYYTQVIRWASQGRLLRDSNRGVLLTDRDQCWMGDQVNVQAILRDASDQPLMSEFVSASLIRPDGSTQLMTLKAAGGAVRPGTFEAQFPTTLEGEYRITLPVPDSPTLDVLSTSVESSIPDLEKAKPQRNDVVLQELAEKTQGHYYVGVESFQSSSGNPFSPDQLIVPQDQETFLTGTLDRFFQRKLMMWLLGWIVLALAFEWTIRRLHKLS